MSSAQRHFVARLGVIIALILFLFVAGCAAQERYEIYNVVTTAEDLWDVAVLLGTDESTGSPMERYYYYIEGHAPYNITAYDAITGEKVTLFSSDFCINSIALSYPMLYFNQHTTISALNLTDNTVTHFAGSYNEQDPSTFEGSLEQCQFYSINFLRFASSGEGSASPPSLLYVADEFTVRVIDMSSEGRVKLIADGFAHISGLAVHPYSGNIYLVDTDDDASASRVWKINSTGHNSSFDFSFPLNGIAVDRFDNVFVIKGPSEEDSQYSSPAVIMMLDDTEDDYFNLVLLEKLDQLDNPYSISMGSDLTGSLFYVVAQSNEGSTIKKFETPFYVNTAAGNGSALDTQTALTVPLGTTMPAKSTPLFSPRDLALVPGRPHLMYVVSGAGLFALDLNAGTTTKIAQPSDSAKDTIVAIVVHPLNGNTYVATETCIKELKINQYHQIISSRVLCGSCGDYSSLPAEGAGTQARFGNLTSLATDSQGNLLALDHKYGLVRMINVATGYASIYAGNLYANDSNAEGDRRDIALIQPTAMLVYDYDLESLLVAAKNGIWHIDMGYAQEYAFLLYGQSGEFIQDMWFNRNIWIGGEPLLVVFMLSSKENTVLSTKPSAEISLNNMDNLFPRANLEEANRFMDGALQPTFANPRSIVLSPYDGRLYIADSDNNRIRRIDCTRPQRFYRDYNGNGLGEPYGYIYGCFQPDGFVNNHNDSLAPAASEFLTDIVPDTITLGSSGGGDGANGMSIAPRNMSLEQRPDQSGYRITGLPSAPSPTNTGPRRISALTFDFRTVKRHVRDDDPLLSTKMHEELEETEEYSSDVALLKLKEASLCNNGSCPASYEVTAEDVTEVRDFNFTAAFSEVVLFVDQDNNGYVEGSSSDRVLARLPIANFGGSNGTSVQVVPLSEVAGFINSTAIPASDLVGVTLMRVVQRTADGRFLFDCMVASREIWFRRKRATAAATTTTTDTTAAAATSTNTSTTLAKLNPNMMSCSVNLNLTNLADVLPGIYKENITTHQGSDYSSSSSSTANAVPVRAALSLVIGSENLGVPNPVTNNSTNDTDTDTNANIEEVIIDHKQIIAALASNSSGGVINDTTTGSNNGTDSFASSITKKKVATTGDDNNGFVAWSIVSSVSMLNVTNITSAGTSDNDINNRTATATSSINGVVMSKNRTKDNGLDPEKVLGVPKEDFGFGPNAMNRIWFTFLTDLYPYLPSAIESQPNTGGDGNNGGSDGGDNNHNNEQYTPIIIDWEAEIGLGEYPYPGDVLPPLDSDNSPLPTTGSVFLQATIIAVVVVCVVVAVLVLIVVVAVAITLEVRRKRRRQKLRGKNFAKLNESVSSDPTATMTTTGTTTSDIELSGSQYTGSLTLRARTFQHSGNGTDDSRPSRANSVISASSTSTTHTLSSTQESDVKITSRLGKGSFGTVYKAELEGEWVAVKTFDFVSEADDAEKQRKMLTEFENEVQVLYKLRHPNVLAFKGAVLTWPNLSIITEYIAHGTVYDWIYRKCAPERIGLSWEQKLSLLHDTARGMAFIHANGIIHRDIKSQNILVGGDNTLQGGGLVAKIADLGLGKLRYRRGEVLGEKSLESIKLHTQLVGTSFWMAPEVAVGEEYGTACDVYSFGIMMSEFLVERMPYHHLPASAKNNVHIKAATDPTFRPRVDDPAEYVLDGRTQPQHLQQPQPQQQQRLCATEEEGRSNKAGTNLFIALMKRCWAQDPSERPSFRDVGNEIKEMMMMMQQSEDHLSRLIRD